MKKIPCLFLFLAMSAFSVFGQTASAAESSLVEKQHAEKQQQVQIEQQKTKAHEQLTKFDLDFKGGTPQQLIDAIGAAKGKTVNAIIASMDANQQIPGFKVRSVDTAALFTALLKASQSFKLQNPSGSGMIVNWSEGFFTDGTPTDDSVWSFHVEGGVPAQDGSICRFYLLTPFLNEGLTVDDITTAVETGWKMFGDADTPRISFHKETQLLIAVGSERKVVMINGVLEALSARRKLTKAADIAVDPKDKQVKP